MSKADDEAPEERSASPPSKGGRPKKPESERRSERVTVNVRPSEREALEAKAEEAGLSISGLMREAALEEKIQSSLSESEHTYLRGVGSGLRKIVDFLRKNDQASYADEIADQTETVIAKIRKITNG